ncbi:winged helix-turn-helix transcriptional regulator [Hazenella sp. IB182357]|uniref:Winged helix-turn-helix transcriptional regulator n=1 Tax=Polycladospora coralii TaxID=2771432 RepID=A0A926N7F4_9BACL|nr:metalloregulator ArsR/SmtB family transcription factor [Polycladospora coralii]MBD1373316.1 winged helix-turn-helix transcriptional regulator [Polycladospora coralii]
MKTTLNALAEPNRLLIVELLRDGPLTVGEIADRLGLKQPQASKHLGVLRHAGLVEMTKIANRRIYNLKAEPFKEIDAWLESYRHIMNERFERLDDYLEDLQRKNVNDDDK